MAKKVVGVKEQRELFIQGCKFIDRARRLYCSKSYQVLGIDQSISSTGWTFRDKKRIGTGSIKPHSYGFSRLINIEIQLRKLTDLKTPFVGIEGYAHNAKWGREQAGEVVGVIKRFLYISKFPVLPVAIQTLKSWIKAKTKAQIMLEVYDRYKIKISDPDAADAFVIADIVHKALFLANDVVIKGITDPDEVRIYLRDAGYQDRKPMRKLFKYQANSLFKLILNHGKNCEFFLKKRPTL